MIEQLKSLAQKYCRSDIYAFGSRAGEIFQRIQGAAPVAEHPKSDIDIGVMPAQGARVLTAEKRADLAIELEDLFDAARVDLVVLPEADPFLALEVIRGELLYAESLDEQARYELYVLRRAGDLMHLKKERMRAILEEGAR